MAGKPVELYLPICRERATQLIWNLLLTCRAISQLFPALGNLIVCSFQKLSWFIIKVASKILSLEVEIHFNINSMIPESGQKSW